MQLLVRKYLEFEPYMLQELLETHVFPGKEFNLIGDDRDNTITVEFTDNEELNGEDADIAYDLFEYLDEISPCLGHKVTGYDARAFEEEGIVELYIESEPTYITV